MERADLEGLVAATMSEFGRADILVNNAGGTPPMEALHTSEAMFNEAFRFNVTSAFLLTRLLVPKMLETAGGGSIVNISSAAGRLAMAGFVAYGTAKAALSFMTRELGREFAPKVRVNAIAVGAVETSALAPFLDDDLRGKMEALTPMRRIGTVEDIAIAALYLASPASGWVTGKIFEVDGGTKPPTGPTSRRHLTRHSASGGDNGLFNTETRSPEEISLVSLREAPCLRVSVLKGRSSAVFER
jgi:7-alpha-hydroxysteroid dehydrogenase